MTEIKKKPTDEERAAIAAEAAQKIVAARERQAEAQAYGERVSTMTHTQKVRELNRIEKTGSLLDAALAIVLRAVLVNTRVTKDEAFDIIGGKKVFRPNWVNEKGTVGSYLR